MKTKITYLILSCFFLIGSFSCSDFLEEKSQNMAYVEKVSDLNELLIGEGYWPVISGNYEVDTSNASQISTWTQLTADMTKYFPYIHLMDDDVSEYLYGNIGTSEKNYIRLKAAHLHHWQPDPFLDSNNEEIEDKNWRKTWSRIAAMNSIIYQIGVLRDHEDDQQLCNRVEGEARFLRAQYYFWLANLYGQPYRKTSAATDLCIPLKTSEEVEDKYFSRATSAEVWGQIVSDLEKATVLLRGIEQTTKYRTNQTAAFVLLSRVHLFMENYEQAVACADSALKKIDYRLLDLNTHQEGSPVYVNSTEVIFTHGPNLMAILHAPIYTSYANAYTSCYTSSDDLMACFSEKDLHRKAFFIERPSPGSGYRCVKTHNYHECVSDFFAIRLPEAYLNKAEALAILGREDEAITTIQELRANRFADADAISESGEELVNFIRDERRRELCFEGHRWFDLRRYAVNSVYPYEKEIRHASMIYSNNSVYQEGVYVLHPYSEDAAAYTLPIPNYAIEFNEGYLTNEVRPTRDMIANQ